MKTVYKYPLGLSDKLYLKMPEGSTLLHLATQREEPTLWAQVDTEKPNVDREFFFVGTGYPFPKEGTYVGTVKLRSDSLVFHLFEAT